MASKRLSMASPGPLSPSAIPRPHSVTGQARMRQVSDTGSSVGENSTSDSRNVRVVLRIRPSYPEDLTVPPRFRSVLVHPTSQMEVRLDVDPGALAGHSAGTMGGAGNRRHPTFTFDHVLGEDATQEELYGVTARETVDEFLKGHNVTFLAYGQTSSGKSYSMGTTGDDVDYHGTEFTPRTGLIPRTVQAIFERAEDIRHQSGPGATWECRLSFLELYNEEIIDLLSGTGVAITIREERDGRIVWAGVREVKVKSLAEVMNLLQEGSERRKTGETTMNASSSRSHAIFSLTLIQKRRIGQAASPTRSETPTRQLRRPSSTIGFPGSASATGLRSPTPSGSRGGPPSSFGRLTPSRPASLMLGPPVNGGGSSGGDDYTIVTSKFNMVDLAGSERLKRTAAHGDRMKEGISINSGLSALGNVISTLSDPIKAGGHVPYRDSKLTRMLQDSIGGNALTTMIACVSPIEANIGETINTVKYASRARNIRNVSKINQVEAGWDDVEHLQSTVLKLRKQLTALEMEDGKGSTSEESLKQSEKLILRLAELQKEHTELYDQYLQKCSENIRLSSELRNRAPGDSDALNDFNETVEPVILEYEKVVSALNQQLDELRDELSAMNETYEVQSRQLEEARERQTENDTYITELRSRLAKLNERNASSEAYIQDLEAKLKSHAEQDDKRTGVIAELKKDIAKLREVHTTLNQHASEVEARLSKSESLSVTLATQVEKREREAATRESAYRDLEAHIALLDTSKDNKLLLEELEQRDRRIEELEQQLEVDSASVDRQRSALSNAVRTEKSTQAELRKRLSAFQSSVASTTGPVSPPPELVEEASDTTISSRSPLLSTKELNPPESPQSSEGVTSTGIDELEALKAALSELSERYEAAESRVVDLTAQLSEARLVGAESDDVSPTSPATPSQNDIDDEASETGTVVQTPRGPSPSTSPSQKRGSMPIVSLVAVKGGQGSGFRGGRGYGEYKRTRPQSLSQELSSAQSSGLSPRASASWVHTGSLLSSSPTMTSEQHAPKPLRSSRSWEAEVKFVHRIVEERDEELKEREAYIQQLEEKLQGLHNVILSRESSAPAVQSAVEEKTTPSINIDIQALDIPLPPSPHTPRQAAVTLPDTDTIYPGENRLKPPEKPVELGTLSPKSERRFSALKDSLQKLGQTGTADTDQTHLRVRELMREMEDKEASQRQMIEQQFIQIADLQKANNKLRDSVAPTASSTESDLATSAALDQLRPKHSEELQAIASGHAETIDDLKREHMEALDKLRETVDSQGADHRRQLEDLLAKHDQTLSDLRSTHEDTLKAMTEVNDLVASEMEFSLVQGEEERRQLKLRADQSLFELSRVRDQFALQRNNDAKQIAELVKAKEQLEKVKSELELANSELRNTIVELGRRNGELERHSKKVVALPPQGPPPTTPLPSLPSQPDNNSVSHEDYFSAARHSASSARTSKALTEAGRDEAQKPECAESIERERDGLKRDLVRENEKVEEVEIKLQEERVKVSNLTVDLREAQRTSSKLRAHLDDARQEIKRTNDACQDHMAELDARREQMSSLSAERNSQKDSLMAANAKVATLKGQLERAVNKKVDKRLLKCF